MPPSLGASRAEGTARIPTMLTQLLESWAAFAVAGPDGTLHAASRGWWELFGYGPDATPPSDLTALFDRDPVHRLLTSVQALIEEHDTQPRRLQLDARTQSGSSFPIEITMNRVWAEAGDTILLTVSSDVTALDRVERSLTAAQSDLRTRLAELEAANASLEREVEERRQMEATLHATNAELKETVNDLKWFNHESDVFGEMAEILQACRNFEEANAAISEYGQKLLPDAAGHFFVFRDSRDALEHVARWGEEYSGEKMLAPECCWALRRGQVHSINNRSRLRCSHVSSQALGAVCIPIIGQGQTLGLLHVAAYHEEWDNAKQGALTLRRLRTMADRVGPALANLKLRETLRSLSIRDPLTGLYNRRYLEESLPRELHRASRTGSPIAAIMIDVDHFKRFNDEFSHDAGDLVLRSFAEIIMNSIRPSDLACRLGGEELVVILPEATTEVALARAESLRVALRALALRHEGKTLGTVTASFGISVYPEHGTTTESLLHSGDTALYRAKREGRDRVCIAGNAS